MRSFSTTIVLTFVTLLLVSTGSAQQTPTTAVPNLIRYGGTLKDAQGTAPIPSTTVGVTFAIYKQQDGGAPVWLETQSVTPDASGQYSVVLGSTTATGLPSDLFSQEEQRWLGVQVQGQSEQPRVLLVSVPYAFKAHEAETLAGKSISDFVLAKDLNSTNSATGIASSSGSGSGSKQAASGKGNSKSPSKLAASAGPTNFSGSTTDQIVGVTQSGTGAGINAIASGNAVVGTSTTGAAYGVYGAARGVGGFGVLGNATATTGYTVGVKGGSVSTSGTGVRGINTATTGTTTGVSAYVNSSAGTAGVFNNAAGGKILSGQNSGVEKFSLDGSGNVNTVSGTYKIGGSNVVNIGSPADDNLFLGVGAGAHNPTGQGTGNTFAGFQTGYKNTAPDNTFFGDQAGYNNTSGYYNVFVGYQAGYSNTLGNPNTFMGTGAGYSNTVGGYNAFFGYATGLSNTDGTSNAFFGGLAGFFNTASDNSFFGYEAGYSNTSGFSNAFFGDRAGSGNTSGVFNAFYGDGAGMGNTNGCCNLFFGHDAGMSNTSGVSNVYLGYAAGGNSGGSNNIAVGDSAGFYNNTGSNNVYVANWGPTSGTDNSTIRIGTQGTGAGQQNITYIAGIYGSTSASGVPVYINSSGQLGTQTSSLRFKEQVRDMSDTTSRLFQLRPVTFFYKPQFDDGSHTLQYGLIAEDVAKVYPDMVAYDKDGQPYTVKYQYLAPMLLNELQKQHIVVAAQQDVIKTQQDQINDLQQRLSRLESLIAKK
jgi:hypothetical protein